MNKPNYEQLIGDLENLILCLIQICRDWLPGSPSGKLSTVSVTHSGCQNVTLTKSFRMGKDVCGLLLSHFQQQKLTEL